MTFFVTFIDLDIMVTSLQALQDENLRLKTQLHMYEQYHVLLRIQRNLAVSLGTSVSMTQAFSMILETVSRIEGVRGSGIIVKNDITGHFILCAQSGVFKEVNENAGVVDPGDSASAYLFKKGVVSCSNIPFLSNLCSDMDHPSSLGVYPVGSQEDIHAVLLVIFDTEFGELSLAKDLLGSISEQIGDVLLRVDKEETIRRSLEEKEILLKEVHHRVKNNLAMISSFISLQETCVEDRSALLILQSLQQKIMSVVGIYELLYKSSSLSSIQFHLYAVQLVQSIIRTLAEDERLISLDFKGDNIVIDIDTAITLGLILAELATNTFKYAFSKGSGIIGLRLYDLKDEIRVMFWDDGKNFPEGFSLEDSGGIGERLVLELTAQLKGSVDFIAEESKYNFRFPKSGQKPSP